MNEFSGSASKIPNLDWYQLSFWTGTTEDIQRLAVILIAILGGVIAVWRVHAVNKSANATATQAKIATQGHITDQLKSAIKELSSDELGLRLGALITLERLAKEFEREKLAINFVILDFVEHRFERKTPVYQRRNSPKIGSANSQSDKEKKLVSTYIRSNELSSKQPIKNVDFSDFDFSFCNFSNLEFVGCLFDRCNFSKAKFFAVKFSRCSFKKSSFVSAKFFNVKFSNSPITGANFFKASVELSDFRSLFAKETNFRHTFFKQVFFSRVDLTNAAFANAHKTRQETLEFKDCELAGVDFSGVRFNSLHGFSEDDFDKISFDKKTRLPIKFMKLMGDWNWRRRIWWSFD